MVRLNMFLLRSGRTREWIENRETGSLTDLTADANGSAALPNDLLHGGQSETGALTGFFRGEEGVEDLGENFVRDSETGVFDTENDAGLFGIRIVGAIRVDDNQAAFGHGIASVDGQIEQHLRDLHGICGQ